MAHVVKGSRSFTCTPTRSNPQSAGAIPAFAFPAIAGTHLPTPEGWKAEFAWVAGYVTSLPVRSQSPIPLLTGLNVEQLR